MFYEATNLLKSALGHVDAGRDHVTWDMLNGLIKLSESLQLLQSDVRDLAPKLDKIGTDVRHLRH